MRCKACRNNGDIADNSSSYVKESGCTNYTLKSVKGHADSKQHRKVEDRIRNKARPLYRIASSDATVNNKPEDAERALSSSSSYCLQYALHMRSIIYCFGGVCAAASTILVVAIAEF